MGGHFTHIIPMFRVSQQLLQVTMLLSDSCHGPCMTPEFVVIDSNSST